MTIVKYTCYHCDSPDLTLLSDPYLLGKCNRCEAILSTQSNKWHWWPPDDPNDFTQHSLVHIENPEGGDCLWYDHVVGGWE